jgi:hypothetical protein
MEKPRELYHEEVSKLKEFRNKIDTHAIYKDDLDEFSEQYEDLVAQAKVITRVSDRLQKKLDNANVQIKEQNDEIKEKNNQLQLTIQQLAKAKIGRKASTIMLGVAIFLFFMEQVFLQPVIEQYLASEIATLGALIILFFLVKFLESGLESYFMNREKRKIIEKEKTALNKEVRTSVLAN